MSVTPAALKLMIEKLYLEAVNSRVEDDWCEKFIYDVKGRLDKGLPFTSYQIMKIEELFEEY